MKGQVFEGLFEAYTKIKQWCEENDINIMIKGGDLERRDGETILRLSIDHRFDVEVSCSEKYRTYISCYDTCDFEEFSEAEFWKQLYFARKNYKESNQ